MVVVGLAGSMRRWCLMLNEKPPKAFSTSLKLFLKLKISKQIHYFHMSEYEYDYCNQIKRSLPKLIHTRTFGTSKITIRLLIEMH